MQVRRLEVNKRDEFCELHALIMCHSSQTNGSEAFPLWFRFPRELYPQIDVDNGDPFLAALLLPAMAMGEPLEIPVPISPRLLFATEQIQAIYRFWDPSLSEVPVHAPLRTSQWQSMSPQRRGLFFSCGVDSFYALLKNTRRHPDDDSSITTLVVIHGFDVFVDKFNNRVFSTILENTQRVGDSLRKEVLPVATNLREVTDSFVHWGSIGHGSNLASIGLALGGVFRSLHIAASNTYAELSPLGSHPLLDPLWSTETLMFVHDGCEATRLQKIALLAQYPIALDSLRVCASLTDKLNCGKCDKCLMTMVALALGGGLDKCKMLPHQIDVQSLRSLPVKSQTRRNFVCQLIDSLEAAGLHLEIKEALQYSLTKAGQNYSGETVRDREWVQKLKGLAREIEELVPENTSYVMVDQGHFAGMVICEGRESLPFPQRDGQYWGPPQDALSAIRELEQLCSERQPQLLVFPFSAFWWFEYYREFTTYLHERFPVIRQTERVVAFDLRSTT